MFSLRRTFQQGWFACCLLWTRLVDTFDREDVLVILGLAMLGYGLWAVSHSAALIVPGIVLLWMFVPSRPPFIERAPARRDVR